MAFIITCAVPSYQERKHRTDRGHGTCRAAGPPERRDGAFKEYILTGKDVRSNEKIEKHADWVETFLPSYPEVNEANIEEILQQEIGKVFVHVLEDAGVYKCTEEGRASSSALSVRYRNRI